MDQHTDLSLSHTDDWFVVTKWRGWMSPQDGTVWKLLKNLLGNRDIGQQHKLFHHGICVSVDWLRKQKIQKCEVLKNEISIAL